MTSGATPGEAGDHWVHNEITPRKVRVVFGGETIAESGRAMLMLEAWHTPLYYFPQEDVRMDLMIRTDHSTH
jgi:uncharacterized protein (DUF427 family)